MIEIYIVIVEDNCGGVEVFPYANADDAIKAAKDRVEMLCSHKEFYKELDLGEVFHAEYSPEDECVRVVKKEMQ